MRMNPLCKVLLPAALIVSPPALAAVCSANSGAQRVALLELYTSEGCDSCPPAERWLNALPARGFASERLIALAFHVDYWNYLGWKDPFAQARFSERQRHANARIRNRTVYTPQLMLDGKDYRRGLSLEALDTDTAAINRSAPGASIRMQLTTAADAINAAVDVRNAPPSAQVFLALSENRLSNQVTAGENRGKRLEHDAVVRELAGPFAPGFFKHRIALNPNWKNRDLTVTVFAQDAASGAVLQALALPYCG
jgi:hypothetical protein